MVDSNLKISDKTSKAGLFIFSLMYIILTSFLVMENVILVMLIYVTGGLFLYLIKPVFSFVFVLLSVIEPIGRVSFGQISIFFILFSCLHFFLNPRKYVLLIKNDKIFKFILFNLLLFLLYQLIFSFRETDGSSYLSYLLKNSRSIFGVFCIFPAYYFTIHERKNLFFSILVISVLTFIYYYISKTGLYEIIPISTLSRSDESDAVRYWSGFDFRYLIKFFGYLLPAFFFWEIQSKPLRTILLFVGIMAFGLLFLALLRLELFYTTMGAFLTVLLLKKSFGIANILIKSLKITFVFLLVFLIFFDQFKTVIDTLIFTLQAFKGQSQDFSAESRIDSIPILLIYFLKNPLWGSGFFSVSYDNINEYFAADVQLIGSLAIYGVFGFMLYFFRYIYIFKAFKKVSIDPVFFEKYKIETIVLYGLGCFFISAILFRFYSIFAELIYGWAYIEYSVLTGIFFGLIRFINYKQDVMLIENIQKE